MKTFCFAEYAKIIIEATHESNEDTVNILLDSIVKKVGIQGKNKLEYTASKETVSRLLNRKDDVYSEIVLSSDLPSVRESIVKYFEDNIVSKMLTNSISDAIYKLKNLISEDDTISPEQKTTLLENAKPDKLAAFISSAFLYSLTKPNKLRKTGDKNISPVNEKNPLDPLMGRKTDLDKLDKAIRKHRVAVISANMGYGKTVLANLYVEQFHKCKFEVIVSMNAVQIIDKMPNLRNLIKEHTDYNNKNLGRAISNDLKLLYNDYDIIIFDNLCDVRNVRLLKVRLICSNISLRNLH